MNQLEIKANASSYFINFTSGSPTKFFRAKTNHFKYIKSTPFSSEKLALSEYIFNRV